MNNASGRKKRLIIVSNRLPFSVSVENEELRFHESAGGLVTGLSAYIDSLRSAPAGSAEYLWVGWPGSSIEERFQAPLKNDAMRFFRSVPVALGEEEMDNFYHGFCNKTIWPLFHYFPTIVDYTEEYWEIYKRVNAKFCDALADIVTPDDIVWVHDYHLMLLPRLLRSRVPAAAIGFFLHIPFPSFEVFRLLPVKWRSEILDGLLGADLVGFHTYEYAQHFLQSVLRIRGFDHHMGQIITSDGVVKVDTFPLGIDFDRFSNALDEPGVRTELHRLEEMLPGVRVILSVDRLDYTKGILNRLQGFEIFLDRHPEYLGKVVLVMIVVPSRIGVDQYALMRKQIEELVGNINGRFGRVGWTPVVYQYRQVPFESLVALYGISEVSLVTPLRDGMNLVAKEYVASRKDDSGALILSEMAGAVKELAEAIVINPNNRGEIADAMLEALELPPAEQKRRMTIMRNRLKRYTAKRWAEEFVRQLVEMRSAQEKFCAKLLDQGAVMNIVSRFRQSSRRLILLDYDGTLVPIVRHPELARPSDKVKDLLKDLSLNPSNSIVVVSGRDRETLDRWLARLPVSLIAEHGVWLKELGKEWKMLRQLKSDWKPALSPILQQYADRVPGAFVEEKEYSLVWHYRNADPEQARTLASELTDNLVSFTANIDVHILQGNKVVEIRNSGVDKGKAAAEWTARGDYDFVLAAGDDWTDEDLFRSLPPSAVSIKVGMANTHATYNVRHQQEIISLLEKISLLQDSGRLKQMPEAR